LPEAKRYNIGVLSNFKSARSRGFAFVEFEDKDVAKIAADNMNGYLVYGRTLECRLIQDDEGLKVRSNKFKFIPYQKKFIEQKNAVIICRLYFI
jgi:nucleolar protein 15